MATITFKENSKIRRRRKQGEFLARKIAMRSRSVEEIWDSIFGVEKKERPVLSLKPTKHYPSGDNCCLPNVAVFSGIKTKQPSSEFGVTARGVNMTEQQELKAEYKEIKRDYMYRARRAIGAKTRRMYIDLALEIRRDIQNIK